MSPVSEPSSSSKDNPRIDQSVRGDRAQVVAEMSGGLAIANVEGGVHIYGDPALTGAQARGASVRFSSRWKPPKLFSLLFDREVQEEKLREFRGHFAETGSVIAFVVPGPDRESPADFISRYEKYTLRRVCYESGLPYHVDCKLLDWPSPSKPDDQRMRSLLEGIAQLIGAPPRLDEVALRKGVAAWMADERKHKVLYYQLFAHKVCVRDAALIRHLLDFWCRLDVSAGSCSITVFFCVHTEPSWFWRWIGNASRCIKRARRIFADMPNVLILDALTAPAVSDVEPWVESHCRQAWELENRSGGESERPFPLHYDELKRSAQAAFAGRKQRPFLMLKAGLDTAIEKAHEEFLNNGPGR